MKIHPKCYKCVHYLLGECEGWVVPCAKYKSAKGWNKKIRR